MEKKEKIIETNLMPPALCMNLFGVLLVRDKSWVDRHIVNHERIHTAQMKELLWVPFYILYILEWFFLIIRYCDWDKAYRSISFEREAYAHGHNLNYLSRRKRFAQWRKNL